MKTLRRFIRYLPFILALLFYSPSLQAAPAFVQGLFGVGTGCNGSSSSTCTATFTASNLVTGNMIVACSDWHTLGSFVSSIVDATNGANTFTDISSEVVYDTTGLGHCYYAKNITGGAKDSITITYNTNVSFPILMIMEVSGVVTLDQWTSSAQTPAPSTSNGGTSGNVTTTSANEILIGYIATASANGLAAGTNFTLPAALQRNNDSMEYRVVSATGTYASTFTLTGASNSLTFILAFSNTVASNPVGIRKAWSY